MASTLKLEIVTPEGTAYSEDGEAVLVDDRHDAFGHVRLGGIAEVLARRIISDTPYEARSVIIGHPQRGGAPSPVDRIMGLIFGARAAEVMLAGGQNQSGCLAKRSFASHWLPSSAEVGMQETFLLSVA